MPRMLSAGSLIDGRYRCVRAVTGWGFGETWQVEDTAQFDARRKVKLLPSDVGMEASLAAYVEAWAAYRGRGVIPIVGHGVCASRRYLVQEHLDAVTLAEWLATHKARPSSAHALTVFDGVCAALEDAHRGGGGPGRAHGALSSECVAVELKFGEPLRVLVMDFGLVDLQPFGARDAQLRYAAPEMVAASRDRSKALRDVARPQSDVFSLGVLLMELLTGNALALPGTGVTWAQLGRDGSEHLAGRMRTLRPDLASSIVEAARASLSHDAAERYESATSMRKALRKAGLWDLVRAAHTTDRDDPHRAPALSEVVRTGTGKVALPRSEVLAVVREEMVEETIPEAERTVEEADATIPAGVTEPLPTNDGVYRGDGHAGSEETVITTASGEFSASSAHVTQDESPSTLVDGDEATDVSAWRSPDATGAIERAADVFTGRRGEPGPEATWTGAVARAEESTTVPVSGSTLPLPAEMMAAQGNPPAWTAQAPQATPTNGRGGSASAWAFFALGLLVVIVLGGAWWASRQ